MILPEFGYGGAEKSFCAVSVALAKKYEVALIVFNLESPPVYPVGGRVISLEVKGGRNWLVKVINFTKRTLRLRQLKKQLNPTHCISFLEGADYINVLSKRNEKVILSIRGSKFHDENIKGFSGWLRTTIMMPLLYNKADALVTVNKGIQEEMKTIVEEKKITTIYNSYNIQSLATSASMELPTVLQKAATKLVITAVGRLAPEKGFQHLIKVYIGVKLAIKNVTLVIVGNGEMADTLIDLCKQTNLSYDASMLGYDAFENPDVIFTGYLANPLPVMKKANVFTLCSSSEGFPNALVEAMSLGVPVVSTDCPYGPNEILNPKNIPRDQSQSLKAEFGILCPQFNEKFSVVTWQNAIVELLSDEKLYTAYARSVQERASHFSSDETLSQWESVISH